jgi:hypothetical protein
MILRLVSGAAVAFALVLTGAVAAVFVAPPSVAACGDETCEARVPSDARLHLPSGYRRRRIRTYGTYIRNRRCVP